MTGDCLLHCFKENLRHDMRECDRIFVESTTQLIEDLKHLGKSYPFPPEHAASLNKMINELSKHRDNILEMEERRNMKARRKEVCE